MTALNVDALRKRVRGEVIGAGDEAYDRARAVYNGMIDRRPTAVVGCMSEQDVVAAVEAAREQGLDLAVRGGSHSVPGFGTVDDGLVVDLSSMRRVQVDPERRTARAQGGATWGDFNVATHAFGRASTGGIVSTTGIGGLTLGGGFGHLARRFGLSCDNLISAQVVTADGQVVRASEQEHPDLFWALRGGGGNFGVVTEFEYRLHPLREIVGGPIVFPLEGDVLRGYSEFLAQAPEELGAILALALAPPLPFLPDSWHLKPVAIILVCWSGKAEEMEEVLRPLEDWATILGRGVSPMPYPTLNTLFDDLLPAGLRHYWKGNFAFDIPEQAIQVHLDHAARVPTLESGTFFFPIDGACHRVGSQETAFAHRDVRYSVGIFGTWPDPADDERNIAWVQEYSDAVQPFSETAGYVNFMNVDDPTRIPATYATNHDRLVVVKTHYDPDNVFHLNQNIRPAPRLQVSE